MHIRSSLCSLFFVFPATLFAQDQIFFVEAGDIPGLVNSIDQSNATPGSDAIIYIRPGPNSEMAFDFPGPLEGTNDALPPISSNVHIAPSPDTGRITLRPSIESADWFRLVRVIDGGELGLGRLDIDEFRLQTNSAGAISLEGDGILMARGTHFNDNFAEYNGGAIDGLQESRAILKDCAFRGNRVGFNGGAINLSGQARATVHNCVFSGNSAGMYGCDISSSADPAPPGTPALDLRNNAFSGSCSTVRFEHPFGLALFLSNSLNAEADGFNSTGTINLFGNAVTLQPPNFMLESGPVTNKPEALCNDFGTGSFNSLGFNIAEDGSCALDQASDLPDTDPLVTWTEDGIPLPAAGSPVIDSGSSDVVVVDGDDLAKLPCGYVDIEGTARPQDSNGDGMFECERGAIEVPGTGQVTAAHSAVFYNPDRNGEGNYVEILDDGRAVVYTFTYKPDGSGPAWFIGVGEYRDNAVIMDELFRPIGSPFGDAFDASLVDFTPAGSMSMVFPDCEASAPGGNIAYTGAASLGFEGLISRATRLAHITGCGTQTPSPNAGLSGSFFDPDRNGEGVIVEWLSNGDVLVVFFTYDPDGNQFWLFGQGQPSGNSVTVQAVYPESVTAWGRDFVPDDVKLGAWGTMTLTWSECDKLTFAYDSVLPGFGTGTHEYVRLSKLAGTTCPAF